MKDYHCCATCQHFKAEKNEKGMHYYCSRLGYGTKTHYKFNCWDPKEHIKKLLQ
ncbi:hypothetical protein [Bacillus sp. MUM 116]|uniref:hypothetical protein n=1 Tax=Bacillus sp. MUM 116 TaxID=1678002 RepID=UPI0015A61BFF|nr:hypothetical protein [Bacillus sp. MUM 116]